MDHVGCARLCLRRSRAGDQHADRRRSLRYEEIVRLDHTPIGRVESGTSAVNAVHVIHSDHLNTPRALANAQTQGGQAAGTVVWRWKLNQQTATGSNAFGPQPADENPDGNASSLRFDLRFPGLQWDAAVGLNYNYFRDYEPGTGRYVESDPIGLRGGVSTYGYVGGSPLAFSDALGLLFTVTLNPFTRNPLHFEDAQQISNAGNGAALAGGMGATLAGAGILLPPAVVTTARICYQVAQSDPCRYAVFVTILGITGCVEGKSPSRIFRDRENIQQMQRDSARSPRRNNGEGPPAD